MNAFNTINLAGAIIITSTSFAKELGVPQDKWVFPLGGAGTKDCDDFWKRPNFNTSPSISRSLDAALASSQTSKSDIDLFDFYSCFPIVPKMASYHLGLPIVNGKRPSTLLGGLTSFGGAGNNYSMHALTEMTRALREGKGKKGLVLANGGVLSYQYVVVLGKEPRKQGGAYPENVLPKEITDVPAPEIVTEPEGMAIIEVYPSLCQIWKQKADQCIQTYTVEFNRDGTPLRGYVVGKLKSTGKRFLANSGDEKTLRRLTNSDDEVVGLVGWVRRDTERKGRNLFTFEERPRL